MLILVAGVSFLVQVYSLGYLGRAARTLGRYYTYQSPFAFSMMSLVLAPNFVQLFISWELVGLCSYLLIGYWYQRPEAARAAVKAFWVTKAGDVGLLIGIVLLWRQAGTFDFIQLLQLVDSRMMPLAGLGLITFCIYLGAVGKSGPVPAARLAARRVEGRPRVGADSCRDDGDGRRVPAQAHSPAVRPHARRWPWWAGSAPSPRSSPPRSPACRATSSACSRTPSVSQLAAT
jgi:NADH-quinone oxidoreductase subunit L